MPAIGDLLSLWGIPVAAEAHRSGRGSNNTTFTVRHNDRCWVLRVSQNLSAPQVAAEHRLLERLRRAGLPFAVPEPVAAHDGRTLVETGEGPLTVCRWLSGVPADLDDPGMRERFSRAYGQLSEALLGHVGRSGLGATRRAADRGFSSSVNLTEPEIRALPVTTARS